MNRYFVRVNYSYKGSPVQCTRRLVQGDSALLSFLADFQVEDFQIVSVRIEWCVN